VAASLPIAFAAGFLSLIHPCVLPLVPGYLSTVASVDVRRLGDRSLTSRVVLSSMPFIFGFTVVFVLLGTAASALWEALRLSQSLLESVAGLILVVLGFVFMGLLPWPERVVAPSLIAGARRRGSNALLGGAFAVCAAPCIGPVLASVLVLASDSETMVEGSALLAAYSAGLAAAFLLAGVAFGRAMGAFRWLRNRFVYIKVASGAMLVTFGLLLFFGYFWILRSIANRALQPLGLD
jgi:cytochrome c-type biogenesis protein